MALVGAASVVAASVVVVFVLESSFSFTQSVSFLPRDIVLHVSQVHDEECFGRVFPTLLARVFVVYTLGN